MRLHRIGGLVLMHSEEFIDKAEMLEVLYWWICDMIFLGFLGKTFGALTNNSLFGQDLRTGASHIAKDLIQRYKAI